MLEALAKGGSSALDVATKEVLPSSKVSYSTDSEGYETTGVTQVDESIKLKGAHITEEGGLDPDPKPPYHFDSDAATSPSHSPTICRELEAALEHRKDVKVVTNKKKNKGRNQKTPLHSKGR